MKIHVLKVHIRPVARKGTKRHARQEKARKGYEKARKGYGKARKGYGMARPSKRHEKVTERHEKVTERHEKVTERHEKVTERHEKVTEKTGNQAQAEMHGSAQSKKRHENTRFEGPYKAGGTKRHEKARKGTKTCIFNHGRKIWRQNQPKRNVYFRAFSCHRPYMGPQNVYFRAFFIALWKALESRILDRACFLLLEISAFSHMPGFKFPVRPSLDRNWVYIRNPDLPPGGTWQFRPMGEGHGSKGPGTPKGSSKGKPSPSPREL